jgi:hypothetical protein
LRARSREFIAVETFCYGNTISAIDALCQGRPAFLRLAAVSLFLTTSIKRGIIIMASLTWTVKTSVAVPGLGSQTTDNAVTLSGDTEFVVQKDVPAGSTASLTFGSIDFTKIVGVLLNSVGEGLTINTNALNASGGNSFSLTAGKAIEWDNTQTASNPITSNVTALYFINAGTKTATAKVGFLSNL